MEIEEVVDGETLASYLNAQNESAKLKLLSGLAYRSTARVLPHTMVEFVSRPSDSYVEDFGRSYKQLFALFVATALAGMASESPSIKMDPNVVMAGSVAASNYADSTGSISSLVCYAASASAEMIFGIIEFDEEHYSFQAQTAISETEDVWRLSQPYNLANLDFWKQIRIDLANGVSGPLWTAQSNSVAAQQWSKAKDLLRKDHRADWSFWIVWYDRLMAGLPVSSSGLLDILNSLSARDIRSGPDIISAELSALLEELQWTNETTLSSASPVEFSFDAYLTVMRMIGVTDTTRHLQDSKIVASYLADAQVQRELLQEFIDDMITLQGGNFAGVLRKRAERLDKEFGRTEDLTLIRAEKVVSLARALETASKESKAREDIGDMLSHDLESLLGGVKGLCRAYFGPAYLTLAPLAELNLDQIDQVEVIRIFDEAVHWLERLGEDQLVPLDHEGVTVFQDMLEEMRETRGFIQDATDQEFREMLEGKFAAQSGAFGLSFGRFFERSSEQAENVDAAANELIKRHKQVKSLKDIVQVVLSIVKWSSGTP